MGMGMDGVGGGWCGMVGWAVHRWMGAGQCGGGWVLGGLEVDGAERCRGGWVLGGAEVDGCWVVWRWMTPGWCAGRWVVWRWALLWLV